MRAVMCKGALTGLGLIVDAGRLDTAHGEWREMEEDGGLRGKKERQELGRG